MTLWSRRNDLIILLLYTSDPAASGDDAGSGRSSTTLNMAPIHLANAALAASAQAVPSG